MKFSPHLYQFVGTFVEILSSKNNRSSKYIYWSTVWAGLIESYSQGLPGLNRPCAATPKLHLPVLKDSVHLNQNCFPPQVTSNSALYCPQSERTQRCIIHTWKPWKYLFCDGFLQALYMTLKAIFFANVKAVGVI